ncbi:MAG: tetratricopeptide repeat protein [Hyphomicrobiales bacterium]
MRLIICIAVLLVLLPGQRASADARSDFKSAMTHYTDQDYRRAIPLLRRAAAFAHHGAQYTLGHLHEQGLGVRPNKVLAYMWFAIAAANTNERAPARRNDVAKHLTRQQLLDAQRQAIICVDSNYKDCNGP